jgi:hypothetical protein
MKYAREISPPVHIMQIRRLCDNVKAAVGTGFEDLRDGIYFSPPSLYSSMYARMCIFKLMYSTRFVTVSWRQLKQLCATTRIKNRLYRGVERLQYRPVNTVVLTLSLLMSYIYGAPCKARNFNVVYIYIYIWTYVWQR